MNQVKKRPPKKAAKPASSTPPGTEGGKKWLIAITVALATFMEVLDDTSVSVALAQIGGNLSAGPDEVTWIVTAQLVAKAVVLPVAGYLATLVGRSRLFSICLLAYGVSSLLCGLAPSLNALVTLRIIQGLCGGMLSPMAQAILTDSFPASQRGMAFAAYGVATVVAPTVGPTLGGYLVDNASWSWVFFVNVPVAVLTAFLVSVLVHDPPALVQERAKRWAGGLRLDYVGFGLAAVGLSALQLALSRGEQDEWFSSGLITMAVIVAAVALVAAVIWEFHHSEPILELRLLKDRTFAAAVLVMFGVGVVLFGSSTQLPLFLQNVLGYAAVKTGLAISPGGVAVLLLMPVVGVLTARVQARWLVLLGLGISAAALYHFTNILSTTVDFRSVAWARVYQSIGLAFLFVPINVAAYASLSKTKTNQAATIVNLAQSLGGSFGIAAVTTLLARRAQFHQSRLVDTLDAFNPNYEQAVQNISGALASFDENLTAASLRAQQAVYGTVQQQATTLSYVDAFYVLAIACLVAMPLVFLMRPNKPGAEDSAAAG